MLEPLLQLPLLLLAAYAGLGLAAGLLAGLLGIGGGLLIVPALIGLFTLQGLAYSVIAHAAVGSSLATIVATAIASAWAHQRHGAINWSQVWQLAPGLAVGALLGALLADQLPTRLLQLVFGVFAIIVSLQMLLNARVEATRPLPGVGKNTAAGLLIGTVSGVVGIGGGSMTVPYLSWHGVTMRRAVATSSACGLPIALAGFIGFIVTGQDAGVMPPLSSGYVYWPAVLVVALFSVLMAPLGARYAHRLPVHRLKQVFALVLMLVGIKLASGW